jgi:hypothetical protein
MKERKITLQKLSCKDNSFVQSIVLSNLYELRKECSKSNSRKAKRTRSWATRQSTCFEHECIKEFHTHYKVFAVILKTATQRRYVRHHNVLRLCVKARKRSRILNGYDYMYKIPALKPSIDYELQILRFQKFLSWHQAVKRNSAASLSEQQFECRDNFRT